MNLQQGSGALLTVVLLLLMSAALLNSTRQQMDDSLSLVADERLYLQQTSLALSALRWGEKQRWPTDKRWQCRMVEQLALRACLIWLEKNAALLRADSGVGSIAFYQWTKRHDENGSLSAVPHGWLDYCPLANEEECIPDSSAARLQPAGNAGSAAAVQP